MKLSFVLLCTLFTVAFANVVEFKNTAENDDVARFETNEVASDDENAVETASEDEDAVETASEDENAVETPSEDEDAVMEKRGCFRRQRCRSGTVKSKYCTRPAKFCFGHFGQRVYVRFRPSFRRKPRVTLGFTRIDTHKDQNVRVRVFAQSVSRSGFYVRFNPWGGSITYQLAVSWMACP